MSIILNTFISITLGTLNFSSLTLDTHYLPNAYTFQSVLPTYIEPCESIAGEESIGKRDKLCLHFKDPSGPRAYKFPFHQPVNIVPSKLMAADDVMVSPVS